MKVYTLAFTDSSTKNVEAETHTISNNVLTLKVSDEPVFLSQMGLIKYLEISEVA